MTKPKSKGKLFIDKDRGTGKTQRRLLLAFDAIRKGSSVRYISWGKLAGYYFDRAMSLALVDFKIPCKALKSQRQIVFENGAKIYFINDGDQMKLQGIESTPIHDD